MATKRFDGTNFVDAEPKRFDVVNWVSAAPKRYDGANWVDAGNALSFTIRNITPPSWISNCSNTYGDTSFKVNMAGTMSLTMQVDGDFGIRPDVTFSITYKSIGPDYTTLCAVHALYADGSTVQITNLMGTADVSTKWDAPATSFTAGIKCVGVKLVFTSDSSSYTRWFEILGFTVNGKSLKFKIN